MLRHLSPKRGPKFHEFHLFNTQHTRTSAWQQSGQSVTEGKYPVLCKIVGCYATQASSADFLHREYWLEISKGIISLVIFPKYVFSFYIFIYFIFIFILSDTDVSIYSITHFFIRLLCFCNLFWCFCNLEYFSLAQLWIDRWVSILLKNSTDKQNG